MTQKTAAIVHYNTPELTQATILSLRKHGGMSWRVVVFDNSDKRPFTTTLEGVEIIDNTKGQIIDFEQELAKYPNRQNRFAKVSDYGSVKHMLSVQYLWSVLPDGFVLMDSDILLTRDINFLWNEQFAACGKVEWFERNSNSKEKNRLCPFLCYMNVSKLTANGARYFDPQRSWWLLPGDVPGNWYDTGASLLEDIIKTKPALVARNYKDLDKCFIHYRSASWRFTNPDEHNKWLEQHRSLWEPSPRMRGIKDVAICAYGRQENRYAREWVEHYLKLGVKKIFIYDNHFKDEEKFIDVLEDYVKQGFVEIIDIHDRANMQCRVYEECYRRHQNEYAWIGFLDFDEFVRYKGTQKLPDKLAKYTEGDVLLINWRIMTDNGLVHYDDRPLKERFTEPMPVDRKVKYDFPEDDHIKSFVRGGLGEVKFKLNPHNPSDPPLYCINPKGERVKQSAFCKCDHSVMRIDHYWTKTAEEWVKVKLSRGYHGNPERTKGIIRDHERRFFQVNERTPEKEAILKELKI